MTAAGAMPGVHIVGGTPGNRDAEREVARNVTDCCVSGYEHVIRAADFLCREHPDIFVYYFII